MRHLRILPALAAIVFFSSFASAQSRDLREISFTGAPRYTQAELLAFTGLKPGSSATQEQIQDAAQRLNDTGLFEEVNFSGNDKGIVYTLKPAPPGAMRPVRFANFAWWQDDEINQALTARVAFYQSDAVPTAGTVRDNVTAALAALLAEKGIANAVVASRLGSVKGLLDHIVFTIDSPRVVIRSLTLTDASPGMRPKLDPVLHDVAGQPWDKDASFDNIASRVGAVYRDQGYRDIALAKQQRSAPAIAASDIELDLTADLSEGEQYHVSQLAWAGSSFLSAADFNRQAALKPGDHDSPTALRESFQSLVNAYGAKGYIDAKITAPPVVDRATHQVAYTVAVDPGPQYHFRSVRWPSLDPKDAKEFDAAWQLKPGDVYDSTYLKQFLTQNARLLHQGYSMNVALQRDPATLSVDLSVTFSKVPPSTH